MTIGACVPLLVKHDGDQAPQDFILLEDECKRRPIDILLKPVKFEYAPDWPTCPATGVAYLADAIMVRKIAFWAAEGWDEGLEDPCLSLTLGLGISELHWRVACDRRALAATSRPAAEEVTVPIRDQQELVQRWYGRFLLHGFRSSDGILRPHPWIPIYIGAVYANWQRPCSPHVTVPAAN